jgi:hypothetical protein
MIKELLKKLPEYLRLQWVQFVIQKQLLSTNILQFSKWVSEQNEIVSKVGSGGDNSKMKTTNKNEEYCEKNQTSNVSRTFSNENIQQLPWRT